MNTAIGFIVGSVLCGGLGFLLASWLAMENKHDAEKVYKAGYLEGYHDGAHLKENRYGAA